METIYVLFDEKLGLFYRARSVTQYGLKNELKMWKTLNGAQKCLETLKSPNLTIKKLSVKDINEE